MAIDGSEKVWSWRRAVEQGLFGVWDLDARHDTVHYSPRWKEHLGFPYAAAADHTAFWRCRVHPADQADMLSALRAHIDGSEPSYEARFRLRSNGSGYRLMLSRGLVLERDARGEALRMVGTMVDLTERPASPTGALLVEQDQPGQPRPGIGAALPFHRLLDDIAPLAPAPQQAALSGPGRERMLGQLSDLLERSLRQVGGR